jgi:hypothetical protein
MVSSGWYKSYWHESLLRLVIVNPTLQKRADSPSVSHPWKHNSHPIGVRLKSELCSARRTFFSLLRIALFGVQN